MDSEVNNGDWIAIMNLSNNASTQTTEATYHFTHCCKFEPEFLKNKIALNDGWSGG